MKFRRIKDLREDHDLLQKDVAHLLGISQQYYSEYEKGNRTITLSHLILTLPKTIIESQGTSSILNVLYVSIIALIIVFVITKLYKNFKGKDILDISEFLFGKFFQFIFGFIFIAYLIFVASLLVRNTSENLKSMYSFLNENNNQKNTDIYLKSELNTMLDMMSMLN